MNIYVFISCLLALFIETLQKDDFSRVEDVRKSDQIMVKPGGVTHTEVKEMGGVKCIFSYTAQGGTGEDWTMEITHSSDKKYFSCSVERPSKTSYLFFVNFKLSMDGAKIKNVEAFGNSDAPLKTDEYQLDKKENHVTHKEGTFSSQLAHIRVHAKRSKKASKSKNEL